MTNQGRIKAVTTHPFLIYMVAQITVLIIFYGPYLIGDRSFFYTDTTFFLEPQAKFLSAALQSHRLPLWNEYAYCGMPQIAITFPSLCYPPDWLLVSMPFSCGLALSMIFHITAAGGGAFLLLQSFGYKSLACITGASIFSLSGYMFSLYSNHSLVAGAAWCVIALWTLRRIEHPDHTKHFWPMLWSALSTLMLLLSGRPEIIVPGTILLVVYLAGAGYLRLRNGTFSFTILTWQIRALFLGFCFSLPVLIPVAEWLSLSRRAAGLQSQEVFLYSAQWYDVLSMFIGPCLGDLRLHQAAYRPLIMPANLPPFISCAFVGPVATTLAIWGALDRSWGWRWPLIGFLVVNLIASLGDTTALAPLAVQFIPGLAFVRFPIKLLIFSIFAISLLAAQGITCFSERRVSTLATTILLMLSAVLGFVLVIGSSNKLLMFQFANSHLYPVQALNGQHLIGSSVLVGATVGIVLTSIVKLSDKIATVNRRCLIVVASLLATLGLNAVLTESSTAGANYFNTPSFAANKIKELQIAEKGDSESRIFNLCIERFTVPPSYLSQDQAKAEVNDYQYIRQLLKPNTGIDFDLREVLGFEGTAKADYLLTGLHSYLESSQSSRPEISEPSDLPLSRFCQVTSTSYTITQKFRRVGIRLPVALLDPDLFKLDFEDEQMNLRIYKNRRYLPRCYLSEHWRWANSHNSVLDSIVSSEKNDFDPKTCTVLESQSNAPKVLDESPDSRKEWTPNDHLVLTERAPEELTINVECKENRVLVLADQVYPGWEAYVDSHQVPIYVANAFNRAVFVPRGVHEIRFRYNPGSLRLGLLLAVLGVLLMLYLAYFESRQTSS